MSVINSYREQWNRRAGKNRYTTKIARLSGPCVTIYERPGATPPPPRVQRKRKDAHQAELERNASRMRTNPTAGESAFWAILKAHGVHQQWRQQVIVGPFIVDVYHRASHLAVELDGVGHKPDRDRRRDDEINRHGVFVLRFTNREVFENPQEVWTRLRNYLDECIVGSRAGTADTSLPARPVLNGHESAPTRHDDSHG